MDPNSSSSSAPPLSEDLWSFLPAHLKQDLLKKYFHHEVCSLIYACISSYGLSGPLQPIVIHPDYPYFTIFDLTYPSLFCYPTFALFRYLIRICTIGCLLDRHTALAFLSTARNHQIEGTWREFSKFLKWLALFMPLPDWEVALQQIPQQFVLVTFHSHWTLSDDLEFVEEYYFKINQSSNWNYVKYPYAGYAQWIQDHATVCSQNRQDPNELPSSFWDLATWANWSSPFFPSVYIEKCNTAFQIWANNNPDEVEAHSPTSLVEEDFSDYSERSYDSGGSHND